MLKIYDDKENQENILTIGLANNQIICPNCNSNNTRKYGYYYKLLEIDAIKENVHTQIRFVYRKLRCRECQSTFMAEKVADINKYLKDEMFLKELINILLDRDLIEFSELKDEEVELLKESLNQNELKDYFVVSRKKIKISQSNYRKRLTLINIKTLHIEKYEEVIEKRKIYKKKEKCEHNEHNKFDR